jgi:hypothetical protein
MAGDAVERWLGDLTPSDRGHAEAVRRIVRRAAPGAEEAVKWGILVWSLDGLVCSVYPVGRGGVNVAFYHGTDLRDPAGLLEGTGKWMRHVKIREKADLRAGPLGALVKEAVRRNHGGGTSAARRPRNSSARRNPGGKADSL